MAALQPTNIIGQKAITGTDLNITNGGVNGILANVNFITTAGGTTVYTISDKNNQWFLGATSQTGVLPNATTLYIGYPFNFVNLSSGAVVIKLNDTTTTLVTLNSQDTIQITCSDISTSNGIWKTAISHQYNTVGTFGSQASSINGAVINQNAIYFQAATNTNPGMVKVPALGNISVDGSGNISIPQSVALSATPTFAAVNATTFVGNVGTSGTATNPITVVSGTVNTILSDIYNAIPGPGISNITSTGDTILITNATGPTTNLEIKAATSTKLGGVIVSGISNITLGVDGSISIPQSVDIAATPTFASVTAAIFTGGLSGNATTASSAAAYTGGPLTVAQTTLPSQSVAIVGGAGSIDCTTANLFYASIVGNTTFTLTGMIDGQVIGLSVTSSGTFTVSFAPTLLWPAGIQPIATDSGTDVYTIEYINGIYYATILQDFS